MKGWHIKTGKSDGMAHWYNDFTFYFGDHIGAPFISFHFPLHHGWRSYPTWLKGGWDYYEPAILTGRLAGGENSSRWWKLGTWLFPANLNHLWRMRHKAYRDAFAIKPEKEPTK